MTAQSAHKVGNDYRLANRSEKHILNLPRLFWVPFSLTASYIISQTYLFLFR